MKSPFNFVILLMGLIFSIIYWNLLLTTNYLDDWYPKIGAFISSHGAMFGGLYLLITED